MLADAQTSGGLLVALPADRVQTFMDAYGAQPNGIAAPVVVGRVERGAAGIRLE